MNKKLKQALSLMMIISFAASPVLSSDMSQKTAKAGFFGDLGDFLGGVREEAGNMFGKAINNSNPQGNPQFNGTTDRDISRDRDRVNRTDTAGNRTEERNIVNRIRDKIGTRKNIEKISKEMDKRNVDTVAVEVEDTGEHFYIIKNQGFVKKYNGDVDVRAEVTTDDVDFVLQRMKDGELGFWERAKVTNRLSDNIVGRDNSVESLKFCIFGGI